MSNTTSGLRKTAAVALGAVGLATLGSVAAAGSASAATSSAHQQHVAHVQAVAHEQHLAHEEHLAHLAHEGHLAHEQHLAHLASAAHASHAAHLAHVNASASSSVQTQDVAYSTSAPSGSPQQIAAQLVPADQLASFDQIISHESGWNVYATNASSGAYGLGQALPGSKMASAGSDWQTSAATQIKWALSYMNDRYGSPNAAWSFWQANNWY
ncbi:aggregation-promoting factor C-terminal-like domain-containing protein [Phaeacidiphilus oryzae]|uniref:aggregation-promoting factor C-terminal-like domain-containing protein n=1 Tax=Phaeacidiphilus oryzae TaxID=348818 RepID=UPI000A947F7B|nr:lytic transglycosylase domain-containing protein [Phaeacidiphilus oryzae]